MLNKKEIALNFSNSAPEYEKHAVLQKELADEIFLRAGVKKQNILDVGCGTGYLTRKLARKFPRAQVIGIDIAPGMIAEAQKRNRLKNLTFAVVDGEKLPYAKGSFDLVISNASLQWMDAQKTIKEIDRVLTKKGSFVFTTFGAQTLQELKESGFRVNKFLAMHTIYLLLVDKFREVELRARVIKQKFRSVKELVCHLKEIGAQSVQSRKRSKTNTFQALRKYKEKYGCDATYEVILGGVKK